MRILKFFSKKEKIKLLTILMLQISLSLLDLIGVAIFGLLGAAPLLLTHCLAWVK
jgi:hypothetical protein